jgi:hypothetical protein
LWNLCRLCHLCRIRHKPHYVERMVMPTGAWSQQLSPAQAA